MAVRVDSAGATSVDPTGNTIQPPTEGSEEARFATISVAMEAATTVVTAPEVAVTISASTVSVVAPTSVRDELIPIPRPVTERGSGSTSTEFSSAGDIMEELTRQMVQQFFASMRSCIDLILSGGSSFEFARVLFENLIGNISHTGGPSQARACPVSYTHLTLPTKRIV